MQQRWWLLAAGIVGIGLAILLFPRPDTGGGEADMSNRDPLDFTAEGVKERPGRFRPGSDPNMPLHRDLPKDQRKGPNPMAEAAAARRAVPEAQYAGRVSAPFTLIRRQLLQEGSDEATVLAQDVTKMISDLRTLRRDPEVFTWEELEVRMDDIVERVEASSFVEDPLVEQSVQRIEDTVAEYHEVKEAEPEGAVEEIDAPG